MGEVITLFGGGGFLGRYVAQELLRAGARVRIAERDPSDAYFLKPLAALGQVQFVAADVTRADSARKAAIGSTGVVNLVGILKGDFDRVHVQGAANAAAAAAATGARAFVQISAIGADPASASAYSASKGRGEAAARDAFPGATILRPSIVFGPEDQFVNRLAGMIERMPVLPVIRGAAKFQPVWVADVARAVAKAALEPQAYAGKTYELGGPQTLSMLELNRWVAEATGHAPKLIDLPDAAGAALARFTGWLPGAPITRDQWQMLQQDNVVAPGARGFDAFGIDSTPLAAVAPQWLVRYRRQGRFSLNAPA